VLLAPSFLQDGRCRPSGDAPILAFVPINSSAMKSEQICRSPATLDRVDQVPAGRRIRGERFGQLPGKSLVTSVQNGGEDSRESTLFASNIVRVAREPRLGDDFMVDGLSLSISTRTNPNNQNET
jgi:hypothetical protein